MVTKGELIKFLMESDLPDDTPVYAWSDYYPTIASDVFEIRPGDQDVARPLGVLSAIAKIVVSE